MRLAFAVLIAVAVIAFGVLASRLTPSSAATAAVATPRPFVTADPNDRSRTDAAVAHARLAAGDASDHGRAVVHGLVLPIEGASVPSDPDLLPNAPRDYRAGWHEGIDFPADPGTTVHAVAAGTVIRIDRDFVDWDAAALESALADAARLGYTPAGTLDRLRGRQVWIDHGDGIVSRYCHLSAVADLSLGDAVSAGTTIGAVGSSGYPEGGPHLHLEIRVGSSYLGDGLAGDALAAAVGRAFD